MTLQTMALFSLVSLASTAIPGPAVCYVSSRGVLGGLHPGLAAVLGVLIADALYMVLSVTGLSAVLAASYELFTLLKWAGAAYLLYMGVRLVLSGVSGRVTPAAAAAATPAAHRSLLGGLTVHAANPKALLYFGSLVPQFVDPASPLAPQLVALAAIHLLTAAAVLVAYAVVSSRLRHSVTGGKTARLFKALAGSSLIGAGISMALVRRP
jgi:homoserine/homoserine lactone efflux protein